MIRCSAFLITIRLHRKQYLTRTQFYIAKLMHNFALCVHIKLILNSEWICDKLSSAHQFSRLFEWCEDIYISMEFRNVLVNWRMALADAPLNGIVNFNLFSINSIDSQFGFMRFGSKNQLKSIYLNRNATIYDCTLIGMPLMLRTVWFNPNLLKLERNSITTADNSISFLSHISISLFITQEYNSVRIDSFMCDWNQHNR